MKKIKVLHIISSMSDGGGQRIVLNYAKDFCNYSNFEFHILSLNKKISNIYSDEIKRNNIKIEFLEYNREVSNKIVSSFLLTRKINNYIDKIKPDIIHIHLFGTLLFCIPALKKHKFQLKYYSLHSNPLRFRGYKLFILRKAFRNYGVKPICVTNEQVLQAKKHYKINDCCVIHNGVDFDSIKNKIVEKKYARDKFKIREDSFVICAVGRLEKIKQFDKLIRIFNEIKQDRNNAILIIAGEGPEIINLKEIVSELNLRDSVYFLGNIKNVVELYCASDIIAITSKSESSSLVLLEAQVCNLKAVISNGVPSESIICKDVIKMKEDASLTDWKKAILSSDFNFKATYSTKDYEVHEMSNKLKNMYLDDLGDQL